MEARQLDIETSDLGTGTLRRAARLASKTRMAVNRAFSFNKTPNRLKRAMSTVMSPLKSSSTANSHATLCVVNAAGVTPSTAPSPNKHGAVAIAASCANLAVLEFLFTYLHIFIRFILA